MKSLLRGLLIAGGVGLTAALTAKAIAQRSRWFNFRGKSVLVTGGSRGLGLVLARQLVDAGAKVTICARSQLDLEAAAAELRARGGEVLAIECDVRDPSEVESTVDAVLSTFGAVDVLFNVAGIIEVGPLDSMTLDDFHDSMNTNCWGALHTVLAVLPDMRRRGWGRIVNVASLGGKRAVPHMLPYSASKFALVGLSNGLRTELSKDGIVVTTVCPALLRTGSPRNARFKGRNREEYAWFSIGDSLPVASMSAPAAARQILAACQRGDGEALIMNPTNLAVYLQQWAPELTTELLALVNRILPEMGGIGQHAARGYDSVSALSPSWLTALGEQAAIRNNELRRYPK